MCVLLQHVNLSCLNLNLIDLEGVVSAFVAHRVKRCRTPARLIEEIDTLPGPPPPCPKGRLNVTVRVNPSPTTLILNQQRGVTTLGARVGTSPAPLRKTGKNGTPHLKESSPALRTSLTSSLCFSWKCSSTSVCDSQVFVTKCAVESSEFSACSEGTSHEHC